MQPGMFGANTRIVQAGADGMRFQDLAEFILQQIGPIAVQNAGAALRQRRRVFFRIHALAGGFHAMHRNACVIQEGVE